MSKKLERSERDCIPAAIFCLYGCCPLRPRLIADAAETRAGAAEQNGGFGVAADSAALLKAEHNSSNATRALTLANGLGLLLLRFFFLSFPRLVNVNAIFFSPRQCGEERCRYVKVT